MPHIEVGFDAYGNVIAVVRREKSGARQNPLGASIRRWANKLERRMVRRQLNGEHFRHGPTHKAYLLEKAEISTPTRREKQNVWNRPSKSLPSLKGKAICKRSAT